MAKIYPPETPEVRENLKRVTGVVLPDDALAKKKNPIQHPDDDAFDSDDLHPA